jgi:phage-related protein (TIGR01555 family)
MAKRKPSGRVQSRDSIQNFLSNVGQGTNNQASGSHYGLHPVSRNRTQMEWAYRGSWIVGRMVDCVAKDMTREGIEINSTDDPGKLSELDKEMARLQVWDKLCETIQWDRLYGGSLAYMQIDGQDSKTPLRIETLEKGQFKGLLPLDRWLVNPSLSDLVIDPGPDYGLPKFYQTVPDTMGMPLLNIHYSRVIRLGGVKLPYWQRISENLWGQSELERLWDRLLAFDSTTAGVAQLVYKAHLRTYSVEDLREILSSGGDAQTGLIQQIAMMRQMQTNEGITLMDAKDKYEAHQYTFSGLDSVLMQFGEQLAGATEIPLIRLFGQSPAGFDTGDSTMRMYNESIKQRQTSKIGPGVEKLYRVGYISTFGNEPPKVFDIKFRPLWQMTDTEKGENASKITDAVNKAYESQIVRRATALKELKQSSRITGVWTNIEDEEIEEAENDPPPSPEALGLELPDPAPIAGPGEKKPDDDKKVEYKPDDAKPFKALDGEGVPKDGTGRFTHGMGLDPKRFDEKGKKNDDGEWAISPLDPVKSKSMREAIQAAHPNTCKAYGTMGEIEPWKLQGPQKLVNIKKVGSYRKNHGDPITVVKRNGEHGIVDGHHRATAAHLQGRSVEANIVDMDRAFSEAADHESANPGLGILGALHLSTELRLRNAPSKTKDSGIRRLINFFLNRDEAHFAESEHPRDATGKWTKSGAQLGSNEGGVYTNAAGDKTYVKYYKNAAQAHSEVLTADLLDELGIITSAPIIKTIKGRTAVVSNWRNVEKIDWSGDTIKNMKPDQRTDLAKMYYAAVLTKNWDVLGVDSTNIMLDKETGHLIQMDTGGAFNFRAQGKHKDYGSDIAELESLMNPSLASGKVFTTLKAVDPKAFDRALSQIKTSASTLGTAEIFERADLQNKMQLFSNYEKRFHALVNHKPVTQAIAKPIEKKVDLTKETAVALNQTGKHQTIHQKLRAVMRAAHEASGPKASVLVASVIKVPPPKPTPDSNRAVGGYTASSSALNQSLRMAKGDLSQLDKGFKNRVEVLDKTIREARDYALPIKLTRGMPNHALPNVEVGATFMDHGYQSASFSKDVAKSFGNHNTVLEITMPKGFKFLSVPSYAKAAEGHYISHAENEAEAILPRETAYRIKKIEQTGTHRILHVDAIASSLQPPGTEWVSSKAAKLKSEKNGSIT